MYVRSNISLATFLQHFAFSVLCTSLCSSFKNVSEDYAAYQIWDAVQVFSSTIGGTLCTHAIPKGLGVGNENINAYSATVTWILKEGSGHLRRILFSWWKGAKLDVESKKWPLRAHFLNDCAMGIEIFMLSKYPHLSTYILCGSTTVLKERRRLRHFDVDGRRRIEAPNKVDGAGGVVRGENVAVVTSDLSS